MNVLVGILGAVGFWLLSVGGVACGGLRLFVTTTRGSLPNCTDEALNVRLDMSSEDFYLIGTDDGMHLLQLQTPGGLLSNEFLFYGGPILYSPGIVVH